MTEAIIETRGLTRRFGPLTAVDGLDLNVPRHAVYGFLGPNGAGKTTTIRMLLGLIRADAGQISLAGHDLRRARQAALASVGSLVEAPATHPHLSGQENLDITATMLGLPKSEIGRVLSVVDLDKAADRKAGGYSLGMRQRLGLARALLGQPKLLILDEPTNGLDPAGIRDVRELIKSLPDRAGVSVFLSSHHLAEIEKTATHLGLMRGGRMIFQGTLAQFENAVGGGITVGVDDTARAAGLLGDSGWTVSAKGETELWCVPPNERALLADMSLREAAAAANRLLVEAGVCVHSLSAGTQSLEDAFLQLTGSGNMEGEHAA